MESVTNQKKQNNRKRKINQKTKKNKKVKINHETNTNPICKRCKKSNVEEINHTLEEYKSYDVQNVQRLCFPCWSNMNEYQRMSNDSSKLMMRIYGDHEIVNNMCTTCQKFAESKEGKIIIEHKNHFMIFSNPNPGQKRLCIQCKLTPVPHGEMVMMRTPYNEYAYNHDTLNQDRMCFSCWKHDTNHKN